MALLGFSVTATTTRTSLADLIAATAGCTMTLLGQTTNIPPVQRASEIVIQPDSTLAGTLYIGGPGVSSTNDAYSMLAATPAFRVGSSANAVLDLSQIFLQMSAGTGRVNVAVTD
jgi:hypothetical protein